MIDFEPRDHFGNALLQGLRPPSGEPLGEWIPQNFRLSREYSEQTGLMELWPWQPGIANAVTDPEIDEISVMKSARTGATAILILGATAYHIVEDPCPIQIVQANEGEAEDFSVEMLSPMIGDNPQVKEKFGRSLGRMRDSSNKLLRKTFLGGFVVISGANSGASFRRRNIRIALADEIDEWPDTIPGQGPPLALFEKRTLAYRNRLFVKISTPTIDGESAIQGSFEDSNQQYFLVPCPKCGAFQKITLSRLKWPKGKPEKAEFECSECSHLVDESKKLDLQKPGFWQAEKPEIRSHAGFHIWQGYSFHPRASWGNIAKEHVAAKGNVEKRKAFTTLVLGECATLHDGDSVAPDGLYDRREEYDGREECPAGVLAITMTVDTQDHWLEGEIKGWGIGEESWGLEHFQIHGNPGLPEVWLELDKFLSLRFLRPDGVELPISITGIDSGGHHAQSVYDFAIARQGRRVYALRGASQMGKPIAERPKHLPKTGVPFILVGTDTAKDLMFSRLRLEAPGPGYYHFPMSYDDTYFAQLTVEKRVKYKSRGVTVHRYQPVPKNAANEATDLNVYAIAMIRTLNPAWKRLERKIDTKAKKISLGGPAAATKADRKKAASRKKKGKYKPGSW